MAITNINSEDRAVQKTFADFLEGELGWENVYAWNEETFGPEGTLGRADEREVVLKRDLRAAIGRLNPELPEGAIEDAVRSMTQYDFSRSTLQHNQEFYAFLRDGVPVSFKDAEGRQQHHKARVIDFANGTDAEGNKHNRFIAVRELKIKGLRTPNYNRRADLVCYVNGLPLVFIELKAVYRNIRAGFDDNLTDYKDTIPHAFYHNAFMVVSNGDRAKYGSITSGWDHFAEWKRNDEKDKGELDAELLLKGMLAHERLLDLVENFILFDDSREGKTRKIVARNHQVLGVNQAVGSVARQEDLQKQFPKEERLRYRVVEVEPRQAADADTVALVEEVEKERPKKTLELVEAAHPDLGKLGVFWHTQGSGKSYSMAFFAEKVRRKLSGKFTFLLMTDRTDLDDQIYKTFRGCGVVDENTPRAATGKELRGLLEQNYRFVFSMIHKFNQDVDPKEPYTDRDDIIVISDEAHRTQAGKLARNMRLALPNASFIGFTGTPLFKEDHLTRRLFGDYVSRYDFKRSEEDGATTKLVYENRGEKLGITTLDLNEKIADKIELAGLDDDEQAKLERLLGKDYEIITAPERLEKVAEDFVAHAAKRWESGKSMLVCIDKITCARMHQLITPLWQAKLEAVRGVDIPKAEAELAACKDESERPRKQKQLDWSLGQAQWLEETIIGLIISEAQNEVRDFNKWGFDIAPHRTLMKQGFETSDGERTDVETAFKSPEHPFRVAVVCAMWLTGFDVECLSTLYIDKPMKAHTLMQAIARANRVYPGKDFGLIVDYNGMLKSLRAALAQYALGDDAEGGEEEIVDPLEERVQALDEAIEKTEAHLRSLGFEPNDLLKATGFDRLRGIRDGAEAVVNAREKGRKRFEILARIVFKRAKALVAEPAVYAYSERHDNIEAIYKKLEERTDVADVTDVLKQLHAIVGRAIETQDIGEDQLDAKRYDLSKIDMEKLRAEFSKKVKRKASVLEDINAAVEEKLKQMLARNPTRMDFYQRYMEIVAEYNSDKDRMTIEETFSQLMELVEGMSEEEKKAAEDGLTEDEYGLFCLLQKEKLGKAEREKVKLASKDLYDSLRKLISRRDRWWEKEQTRSEVEVEIRDALYLQLPDPPFDEATKEAAANEIFDHVWQLSQSGGG